MGRYIDEILQPGEKVLYSTNAHWFFFLPAIAGWVVAIVFVVLSYLVAPGGVLAAMTGGAPQAGDCRVIALQVPLLDAQRHLVLCPAGS